MKTTRYGWGLICAGLVAAAAAAPAQAASTPQGVVVRFSCPLYDVAGTATPAKGPAQNVCKNLVGWFDGKIDWVSGGQVVFTEGGPLHGLPDGTNVSLIEVYADGNNDALAFGSSYDSLNSVLLLPNLSVRLSYRPDPKKPYQVVSEEAYYPYASALWSKHCEDCIQIQADVVALKSALQAETSERKSDVSALWAAIQMMMGGGGGAGGGFVTLSGDQAVGGTKTFSSPIVGTVTTALDFLGSLAGDIIGPEHATRVVAIQGIPVAAAASLPPDGTVLRYDAAAGQWVPKLLCQGLCQDCNNQAADGCESNVLHDANNCGCCGHACPSAPNAAPKCAVGECTIACNPGFGNCNNDNTDGCEVPLASDPNNCGGCGIHCPGGVCVGGACACPTGLATCFGQCVDLASDPGNCGACGNKCPSGQCVSGSCTTSCPPGTLLCNGTCVNTSTDPANCGTCGMVCAPGATCSMGVCTAACPPGTTLCNGICVNLSNSSTNCGACGVVCPIGATCNAGVCSTACPPGYALCGGVCTNLVSNPSNCGGCGVVCPAGASCAQGVCVMTSSCNDGIRNGSETDVDCGGATCPRCPIGKACFANTDCQSGMCVGGICQSSALPNGALCSTNSQCASGYCSGGVCQSFLQPNGAPCASNMDCASGICSGGICQASALPNGSPCNTNSQCASGLCQSGLCQSAQTCPAGQVLCGVTCTSVFSDPNNCGGCGNVCVPEPNAMVACTMGVCTIGTCNPGFRNCDNQYFNGCETNVVSDVNNCGGCGIVCSSPNGTATCSNGTCTVGYCSPGFSDCDGNPANGCETNVTNSTANCGACGHVCFVANGSAACFSGTCTIGSCNAGYADCNGFSGDGCETNLTNNSNNCGACGQVCPAGHSCVGSVCQ